MRVFISLCCLMLLSQTASWAETVKVGDRVYVKPLKEYGTVIEGGFQGAFAYHPKIRLDSFVATHHDDPNFGQIVDSTFVTKAGEGSPAAPQSTVTGRDQANQAQGAQTSPAEAKPVAQKQPHQQPVAQKQNAQPQQQPSSNPPGGIGNLPGGLYVCSKISSGAGLMGFGNIEIRGNTYRGTDVTGGFAPFSIDGGGRIKFSSGLTGIESDYDLGNSYVGKNNSGQPTIFVRWVHTRKIAGLTPFTSSDGCECVREK